MIDSNMNSQANLVTVTTISCNRNDIKITVEIQHSCSSQAHVTLCCRPHHKERKKVMMYGHHMKMTFSSRCSKVSKLIQGIGLPDHGVGMGNGSQMAMMMDI